MSFSNYLETEVLEWAFTGSGGTRPTAWYLALFTSAPSDSGGGTEVIINNFGAEVTTRDNGIVGGKTQLEIMVKGTLSEIVGRNGAVPVAAGVTSR